MSFASRELLEQQTLADTARSLLSYFHGLREPSFRLVDLHRSFPSVDGGVLRKVITKFVQAGLLSPGEGGGVYRVSSHKLQTVRIK
jgi:hypothetical protein